MSTILLKSGSGKWKYKTTTDDPLFANILGAIAEEGIILPETLVIPGALGETLDKDWRYIEILKETMKDNKINHILYRYDMSILVNALTLPEGWESYVVVDDRCPFVEHVSHMRNSLNYMRKNSHLFSYLEGFMTPYMCSLYNRSDDPLTRQMNNGNITKSGISLLSPFIQNLRLNELKYDVTIPIPYMSLDYLLTRIDWDVVLEVISEYKDDKRVKGLISIVEAKIKHRYYMGELL